MLIPRRPREDESGPEDAGGTDVARRVLAHAASPEEKLERLLAERSRELEEKAARFEEAMADLERREELLRDMRASVERLLRQGTTDLGEREVELRELSREFLEREARLSAEEAELPRRRSELGAVELRREAVEQRERALTAREEELAAAEARRAATAAPETAPVRAAGDPSEAARPVSLLFVPGASYRLLEVEEQELAPGAVLSLEDEPYVVSRIGPAPFPGDSRRCAYLERGPSAAPASGGSS
jgi:DNA repair exonuclease SbcCD ATPase subunit